MSDAQQVEYLRSVLALDPASRTESILAARELRRASKQATAAPSRGPAHYQGPSHQQLSAELASVRESFFERPPDVVAAELAALPLARFADLEHAAARLARVNALRDELEQLAADSSVDAFLVRKLRQLLVAEPTEAASLRSQALLAARQPKQAKASRRFAETLSKSYPELAELEKEWLQQLKQSRSVARDSRKWTVSFVAIALGVLMLARLLRDFLQWLNS